MQVPDFNPEYVFWWLMLYVFLIYYVAGCRAFNVFSAEVFERAMNVFKVINSTGNACGFVCHWEVCVCVIACYYIIKYACLPRWLEWLGRWTHNSVVANSIAGCCCNYYWHGWPSSGGQTTSVFHQATQANSASYFQQNGKWVPAKVWWCSAAGE